MSDFQPVGLQHKPFFDKALTWENSKSSSDSFGNVFLWDVFCRRNVAALGERLGVNAQRVRWKKHHGGGTFTVDELRQWCKALGITSAEEVGKAILYE